MPRLILVFTGRKAHFVGFVMRRLNLFMVITALECLCMLFKKHAALNIYNFQSIPCFCFKAPRQTNSDHNMSHNMRNMSWAAPSEFDSYRLCEQRRFRRACASAQSRQNLRCSLIQAVSQEKPSTRKPDPWPLWMAGHAQLNFVMTECSKTQICLTRPSSAICEQQKRRSARASVQH